MNDGFISSRLAAVCFQNVLYVPYLCLYSGYRFRPVLCEPFQVLTENVNKLTDLRFLWQI